METWTQSLDDGKELISVIIPVYNVERYLDKCIQSVVNQSYLKLQIILIDDGSTDNSGCICDDWSRQDDRILVVHQKNSGVSKARNVGIEHAEGEYICFVDADDCLEDDGLNNLYSKMKEDTQLVCGGYIDESIYGDVYVNDFDKYDDLYECILHGTGGVPWGKLYRKDIINNHHIRFHEEIYISEDMIYNLEYASFVQRWNKVQESVYKYNRLNMGSAMASVGFNDLKCYMDFCKLLSDILCRNGYSDAIVNDLVIEKKRMILEKLVCSCCTLKQIQLLYGNCIVYNFFMNEAGRKSKLINWFEDKRWYRVLLFNDFMRLKKFIRNKFI